MRWEELTGDRFAEAVAECGGVCPIALSVVERHGHHLPLGTDTMIGRESLTRVAAQGPVIEFPDYVFTQIPEVRHRAGTLRSIPVVAPSPQRKKRIFCRAPEMVYSSCQASDH
jgi:creatinine amidohydrolase